MLLLLGIAAGAVTLRLERDDRRIVQREATRFAGAIEQAIAIAQWQGATLGVSAEGPSYRFWRQDGAAEWHVITEDETLTPHALPDGFDVHAERFAGGAVAPYSILPLRATGRNDPYDVALSSANWTAHIAADPLNRVRFDVLAREH